MKENKVLHSGKFKLCEFWKILQQKIEKLLKNLVKSASSEKNLVEKYFIGPPEKYWLVLNSVKSFYLSKWANMILKLKQK